AATCLPPSVTAREIGLPTPSPRRLLFPVCSSQRKTWPRSSAEARVRASGDRASLTTLASCPVRRNTGARAFGRCHPPTWISLSTASAMRNEPSLVSPPTKSAAGLPRIIRLTRARQFGGNGGPLTERGAAVSPLPIDADSSAPTMDKENMIETSRRQG